MSNHLYNIYDITGVVSRNWNPLFQASAWTSATLTSGRQKRPGWQLTLHVLQDQRHGRLEPDAVAMGKDTQNKMARDDKG
jgi:hypothetical protein